MTTRAEEIASEGPYKVEKDSPINEWRIVYGGLPRMTFAREWTAICVCRELNASYKQGQQDGGISVEEVKEILRDAIWGEHNRPRQEHRKRFMNQHGGL